MKKIIIGFVVLVISSIQLIPVDVTPFDSFMGMNWGMDAENLKTRFEEKYEYELNKYSQGFSFEGLKLGSVNILLTSLGFKTAEEEIKFKKSNYSQFLFKFVFLEFGTNKFETMLDILKEKYGEPKSSKEYKILITIRDETEYSVENAFVKKVIATGENSKKVESIQKEVFWENKGRGILLSRFYRGNGHRGSVHFYEIDKDKIKKAGDIL